MKIATLLHCYIVGRKRQLNSGFTLIELLIVITIFGLTASLVTASYLSFERNQVLKNAAKSLKSDLRFTQNKALSGDKGQVSDCPSTSTLVGWYLNVAQDATSYTVSGDCRTGTGESSFGAKTLTLPPGAKIKSILYGVSTKSAVNILFQPLASGVTFWNTTSTPPASGGAFLTSTGLIDQNKLVGSIPQESVTIELSSTVTSSTYQVVITPSGEISEKKP